SCALPYRPREMRSRCACCLRCVARWRRTKITTTITIIRTNPPAPEPANRATLAPDEEEDGASTVNDAILQEDMAVEPGSDAGVVSGQDRQVVAATTGLYVLEGHK